MHSRNRSSLLTWMLVLELGQIIDILIHDDPQVVRLRVRRDIGFGERLRHGCKTIRLCKRKEVGGRYGDEQGEDESKRGG